VKAFACELVCIHACAFVGLVTLANTTLTVDDSECNSDDEEDDDEALEKAEACAISQEETRKACA